ncbi:hypothetical protein CCACVL1_30449 [Corchorus capsularis]|uniref:DUF7054 domain-containing protein n=1 Tax=Corchorus capsularis TaxID=210143 RepID=A0A1R3FX52_COCAP|nr:hypothetical protein CCACVL1_30449 [Corchorus capsularis]
MAMVPCAPSSRSRLSCVRVLLTSSESEGSNTFEADINGWRGVPQTQRLTDGYGFPNQRQRLTKLLVKVNMEKSAGALHVVLPSENTVNDLIKAAIGIYVREKRRPLLKETEPKFFQLHYSPFTLESLNPDEKLISLGSRNFFLYFKPCCCSEENMASSSKSL